MSAIEEKRTTRQIIWGTLVDLRAQGQIATRQVLAEVTSLKLTTVDDHLNRMVEDGQLRRPVAGVVEIIDQMPEPRPVSLLHNPGGCSKLEVGDVCLDLWPQERRLLATLLAGDMVQYSNIQFGQETGIAMAQMLSELRKEKAARKALEAEVRKLQGQGAQMDLLAAAQ